MPDFWEKDKKVDANDWWAGDTAVADTPANVYSGITDPNEAYKKAVEVQDMAVKYNMPFSVPERYLDLNTGKPVMTWKDLTPEVTGRTKTGIVSTKAKEESRPPAPSPKPQKEKALPKFGGALGTSFGLSGMNLNPENLPAIIEENYDFTNQPAWDSFTVEEYYEQHPEKRPREYKNFIDELMRNFGGGSLKVFAGITGTLATGVEQAWGPSYDEILSTDNLYKYAQRTYEKSRSPELSPAAGGGWKGFVASSVGQAGPYMAAAVGATYLTGSPMGAFGVAFAIEGDDAARTVIENGGTEEQANMHRFVVGTINGVIEHIQISQLYKFANVGRGSVKQIASEAKKRALRKILAQGGKATYKAVTHATREAIEETLQEFTSIAAESRFNEQAWDNASYRLFSSGLGGGVVGLIFGVGGRIGNNGIAILDGRKKGALSKALQKELGVSKTLADKASSMVAEGVPIPEVDQMLSQAKVLGEETALAEVEPAPELTEKAPEPAPVATKPEIAPAEQGGVKLRPDEHTSEEVISIKGEDVGTVMFNKTASDRIKLEWIKIDENKRGSGVGVSVLKKIFSGNPNVNFIDGEAMGDDIGYWKRIGATVSGDKFTITRQALAQPPAAKQPIVAYHGTSAATPIDTFDGGDLGFHFGTEEQALARKPKSVIIATLDIKNPLRMKDVLHWGSDAIDELQSMGIITPEEHTNLTKAYWRDIPLPVAETAEHARRKEQYQRMEPVRELLESKGYDGIVYENAAEGKGDSYIAFRPEQIKTEYPELAKPSPNAQPPAPAKTIKQPWEMTQSKYAGDMWQGELQRFRDRPDILETKNREEEIKHFRELHAGAVAKAIEQGKPVPAEVLAEYPDLAPAKAEKLVEPKKVEPKPLKKAVTVSGKKFHPQTLPVESIGVDADKFQFKLGARLEGGVTDALKAVEKFDPIKGGTILVWQDKAGKHWVIDGHHRVALARKTGQTEMDAWVVREEDGWTAADARAVGALRNLADGKGTAVDAAKLFRDSDISLTQLRKEGVPYESTIVQQGLQMKNLSDAVFKMVVNERLPANMAAVIGKNIDGAAQQKQVADLILEGEVDTVRQAELLAMTIDSAPVLSKSEMTLFGMETTEKSLYAERAKILANVEKKLKTNKKVFGTLAKQSGLIESKGNVLDKIANMQTKELAEEVLYMLEKFANAKGEVAEALNDATKEYAKNPTRENLSRITNDLVQKWTKATTGLTLQNVKGLFGTPAKRAEEAVKTIQTSVGTIEIPREDLDVKWDKALEVIFDYGNQTAAGKPAQPGLSRSLSMGDTVEYEGKNWLVMPQGWQDVSQLTKEQIKKLTEPDIKGKAGFVNVEPVEKAFAAFVKMGRYSKKAAVAGGKATMNIVEPSKAVEIKHGKDVYATVIRGIHKPDVARIEYNEQEIENLDGSVREFGEKLAKYSNEILTNLMLSRGKPASANAIAIQEEARKALVEEAPELVGLQKMITRISDANYKFLQDVVGDKINYVEDYFYGIYKNPKKVERFLDYWKTTKRFTKQKKLPTVADAMAYGLELRDPNPINNLRSEFMAISRLDGMIWMRDELMRTGEDQYISKNPEAIADAEKIAEPVFKGLWIEPDLARMIKSLISANKVQQHPYLNALRKTNNFLRSVKFTFSMFHHMAVAKQSFVDSGYLGFLHKKTAYRGLTRGFKKGDPIFQTAEYKDYVENGGGHRYSIDSQAQRTFTQAIEKLTKSSQLIVRGATAPLRIPEGYVKWLFESYIPKVKYSKYLDTVNEKSKKLGRELTGAEKIDIIKEGQNFYGMMNERLFGRSGTVTSAMRFKFMSPGWAEGNYRTTLKTILQWGQGGSFSAGRSRASIVNAFIATAIAGGIGTLIMTGKPPKKPEAMADIRDLFKIDTGKVDAKGRKIMFDLMSFDKDYWAIFGKPLVGQAGEVPVDVIRRLGGMTSTTWDVMSDLNQMSMGHAIYDWKGNRVVEVTDPFARRVLALVIHEIKKTEPISFNIYGQSRERGLDRLTAGLTTLLGARPTTSEKDKRESEIISRIFSLRDRQERLYYFLGSIKEPRKHIDHYNKIAQGIMDNPIVTEDMRKKWGKNIIIDTERLMANKVHSHELLKVTEVPKPDEVVKTGKWLKNFGISESQYRKHLIVYEMKHRKLILEMDARDGDDLLKDEIARFYADKGIVDRKVRGGTATDAEKRLARKYGALGSNISEIGTRIHKSMDTGDRKRYYDRIRSVIERI